MLKVFLTASQAAQVILSAHSWAVSSGARMTAMAMSARTSVSR